METDNLSITSVTCCLSTLATIATPLPINITLAPRPMVQTIVITWDAITWSKLCSLWTFSASVLFRYYYWSRSLDFTIEPASSRTARPLAPVSHDAINRARNFTITWSKCCVIVWAALFLQYSPVVIFTFHWSVLHSCAKDKINEYNTYESKLKLAFATVLFVPWHLRKLSYKLLLVNSHQLSCNSCSRLTRTWELRKFSYKLSLVNSHQLSCNSCSRLIRTWELRKLSYKLSLVNSHQLSRNTCSFLTGTWELKELSNKLSLVNSRQLSCNSCSLSTMTWELTSEILAFNSHHLTIICCFRWTKLPGFCL